MIDVRDPANPRLLSSLPDLDAGLFELHRGRRAGAASGTPRRCIQECRYAWLAGSSAGIDVVDLRDPAHPRRPAASRRARRPASIGTHDVQVDGSGLAWVAGGNGTAAYDVSNPVRPRLVKRTDRRGSRRR